MKFIENILQTAETGYKLYQTELFLGALAALCVLMVLTLLAVRRCRKQIRRLTENTKEMTKAALSRNSLAAQREESHRRQEALAQQGRAPVTREKEELFGSVIQEIFP